MNSTYYLSMNLLCVDCCKPIHDEKNGYTIRDEDGHAHGYLCQACGERRENGGAR